MARLPLVSPLDRALFLKAQPYLAGLSPRVVAALAQHTEEVAFAPDAPVYEAGRAPERIYFLSSGAVRTVYEGYAPLSTAAPGGIGLIEYLAESEQPPRAWAHGDVFALSLDVATLLQLVEDEFVLYMTFARNLARAALDELRSRPPAQRAEAGFSQAREREELEAVDLVQRIARARESAFFDGSSLTVMTQLLRFQEPRLLRAGEILWAQGSPVESLALVLDGSLASACDAGETAQPAGSTLGAWELFADETRREEVRATTAARVVEIDRGLFADMLEDHFEFAMDYLAKLSRRVIGLRLVRSE